MIESNYSPSMLEKFTTRPWAFFISGRNVLVTSINPHRLTSAMRLYFSNGSHSTGAITVIPALFTSPQSPENGGKQFSFNDRGKEHSAHFGWLFTGPLKKTVLLVLIRKPCLPINHFLALFPPRNNEATFENVLLSCRILSEWKRGGHICDFSLLCYFS